MVRRGADTVKQNPALTCGARHKGVAARAAVAARELRPPLLRNNRPLAGARGGIAMKRICALGVVVLFLWGPSVQAAVVQGVILRVDVASDRLQIAEPGGREFTFDRSRDAVVTLNGEPVPFILLQPRWKVTVTVSPRTGEAVRIDAIGP
jgi:hypothetical protein